MRAPLRRSVRQNSRIFEGICYAASTKLRRSAALRYFRWPKLLKRLPEKQGCSRIAASAETVWPILFQHRRYLRNCNEFAHTTMHGKLTDARILLENTEVMARPKRFELLTPRFVVLRD